MAVYVMADLHLSKNSATNKSMDVFGARWQGYMEKIERNWRSLVADTDTVIIPGDISWAMTQEEAKEDFLFLDSLPGRKILMKGNHDFWWQSMQKNNAFLEKAGITSLCFLYHSAMQVERLIIAGTRGWFWEEGPSGASSPEIQKLIAREAIRLEMSLKDALQLQEVHPDCEIVVFFHFPPVWQGKEVAPLTDLLRLYGIKRCYYGHIHGAYHLPSRTEGDGFIAIQSAADYISFTPLLIPQ